MPCPQTGATQYHTQLGLTDRGHAIKWLVVCNNLDLEPLDLLNGIATKYDSCKGLKLKVLLNLSFLDNCNLLYLLNLLS